VIDERPPGPPDPRTGDPADVLERPETLGVLGGMGPLATADFLRKLVELSPAEQDWEQLPIVLGSWPHVPDRIAPILGLDSPSPLPSVIACARTLIGAGARAVALPCNTVHYWHEALAAAVDVPVFHIVDEVAKRLPEGTRRVGLMATQGTLKAGLYPQRLGALGVECIQPDDDVLVEALLPAIAAVKRARLDEAAPLLEGTLHHLLGRVDVVILACTELPPVVANLSAELQGACVDSNATLARACVEWAYEQRG